MLAVLASAVPGAAQDEAKASGRLEPTSASAAAKKHFWAGIEDIENIFSQRGAKHLEQALAADPGFGLARVMYGRFAPGLTDEKREQEIARGLGDVMNTSGLELLVALAYRAWRPARPIEAQVLFGAAAELLPEEPHLAYYAANSAADLYERAQVLEEVADEFPDFAPTFNELVYARIELDDLEGSLEAAEEYLRLLPDHPNPHDTYAELLHRSGRSQEAAAHYQHAIERDADYIAAYRGLAATKQVMGKGEEARSHLTRAIERAADPAEKLELMSQIAFSYLGGGNIKAALRQLGTVGVRANEAGLVQAEATAHRHLALIEAVLGDRDAATTHLDRAAEVAGEDDLEQIAMTALVDAARGEIEAAQVAVERFEALYTYEGAALQRLRLKWAATALITLADTTVEFEGGEDAKWATAASVIDRAGPAGILAKVYLAEAI
ncbi:MAG: hypothetical protein HY705_04795, partial [Gemmatimonadetes bacterium]|nr:hypothetical protein [Gemmatimonadota bacterium]